MGSVLVHCYVVQYFVSFLSYEREREREGERERDDGFILFAYLVYFDCYCSVAFLVVALVSLQCLILVCPYHTHLLFWPTDNRGFKT